MRTSPLLHVLVLSLVALMGCAGPDTDHNNGTVDNPDGTTNPGDTSSFEAVIAMSADTGTFIVEGEPVNPDLCEGNSCEYPVHTADGYEYDLNLDMSGFLTVTHTVRVENDDNGELFEVNWTDEGTYGVDIDWWCTDEDGDSIHLYTDIVEDDNGTERVILDGTVANDELTLTDTELSGPDGFDIGGYIDMEEETIHFLVNGDERLYTDCHE